MQLSQHHSNGIRDSSLDDAIAFLDTVDDLVRVNYGIDTRNVEVCSSTLLSWMERPLFTPEQAARQIAYNYHSQSTNFA